ncbi:Integration host factor subunit beta [Bibersteinia trehalosi USDA-ARS-USMARC-188]|uniref:Integration host factor subunit beta n=5 Tax=Bibersteinia trehalosi TaxID=47735 RepID=W0R7F8_BIBTR|nr:integration host factor subunit beta [Bibersteinia trehalosi]AGH38404.1 Integration host factor subunit beta [Bibersteinia trehalosi USDA-ARS-USMARC-192]AHG81797.1 Integration host factor subunit beta [Bibersteinia trehalosi USDA-ARS-USMARC-188]AHG84086.1 Integration host factor subunit beta [Bibersteinia trehalosi USDA-ARS-USMARC-189]AHG86392.1 Integration host factor subunit beta [Bibersteinia trehalosi USDA-ARS-USMARC-190]OAQ15093.1 integration host factor subunit beta [Bibersteinia treh
MTKSELIENLVAKNPSIQSKSVDECVKEILEQMIAALEKGSRIEVRGFGSFSLHYRQSRVGRNPKTGDSVKLSSKYVPHFKAGKELKERVDLS